MASICDSYCKGCAYSQRFGGDGMRYCTYFESTGARRPCPAGTGCTVKETGKKRYQWRKEEDERWKNFRRERDRRRGSNGDHLL